MTQANPVFQKVMQLSGISLKKNETEEQAIMRGLSVIEKKANDETQTISSYSLRVNSILGVITSFAKLDYSHQAKISDELDFIDALASGINMLGEELKDSTVSLHEKEVMLKEIHHRVKNNLQIISSLLNLQADQIDDITFKEKYRVSRDRIRSMALVHEKLYESENLALVDFGDYVNSLANSLNVSYNPDMLRIQMNIKVKEGSGLFKIETAIPCGLILNEMLSNSFKYAFPGEAKGKVDVFFGSIGKKGELPLYMLEVKDNGVGIPCEIDITSSETLGFQLITMLSEQLNGDLAIERNNGTGFSLTFTEGK
ncbi:MAG: histidine kinase dimerization/phosphoacceptor domain -containing protein [Bacteroidia bacterium]